MDVLADSTDVTTYFVLRLAADGTEATGLTITNFDLQYVRSGAAPAAKVDATALAATNSAHGDNQAIEIDATDQPGLYRVDWPDAAFAAGVREVILTVKCATCFTEHLRVNLTPVPVNVTQFGSSAGTFSGGRPEVNASHAAGTAWNSGAITANTLATDCITAAKIANGAIDAATFAADVDAEILSYLVDDATRIDASALNTASGAIGSNGSGLTEAGGTGDHLTAIPWNASWDAEVQSEVTDALNAYDPPTNTEMEARTLTAASYATAANLATVAGYIDTEISTLLTAVADLPTNAELATALAGIPDPSSDVTAIKAKTDQLTFGVSNVLNANVTYVNEVEVSGVGSSADPWGPA